MNQSLRVLMAGYEVAPFYKRGGLGDVMGALPKALRDINIDAKVVMPHYNNLTMQNEAQKVGEFSIEFDNSIHQVSVYESFFGLQHVPIYFLSNKLYLSYDNVRGKNKRIEQFVFFDLAVAYFILFLQREKKWRLDIIHCNDWHTALIPLIIGHMNLSVASLLTIHNLKYQGKGSIRILDLLHVKDEETKILKPGIAANELNVLGEGILHATRVSTVSKTYAKEITDRKIHDEIYGFISRRAQEGLPNGDGKISGILNGIDYDVWNPSSDTQIEAQYSASNWQEGKAKCKKALLQDLQMPDRPTFCFIGRMAKQKGLDILIRSLPSLVPLNINIILLGMGEPSIEAAAKRAEEKYKDSVRAIIDYNEDLAHKIYAGSDFILIPSHYEPCGLIQMIAMKYGTIPLASQTGGLADSILNGKDGLLYQANSKRAFAKSIKKALGIYGDIKRYHHIVERAMKKDFSWRKSARAYKALYLEILESQIKSEEVSK